MSELAHTDVLIDRVINRTAVPADWSALAKLAGTDEQVWADVTNALRADDAARAVADEVSTAAGRIALPEVVVPSPPLVERPIKVAPRYATQPLRALFRWSGWLAAAVVTLAFVVNGPFGGHPSLDAPPQVQSAALTSDAALSAYMRAGQEEGRILELLPPVTIQAVRSAEGGFEVVFVRRIVERTIVEDDSVFRLASDEHGRQVVIPAGDALRRRRGSL